MKMIKSFPKTINEVMIWFNGMKPYTLAVDVETDGLRWNCELKGVSFCDGIKACYINLECNPDRKRIIDFILQKISEVDLLIMHNASFDLRVLNKYGLEY